MSKSDRTQTLQQITDVEQRLVQLRKQEEEAEATLRSLRESLSRGKGDTETNSNHLELGHISLGKELSRSEKVSLFLRLFRGRGPLGGRTRVRSDRHRRAHERLPGGPQKPGTARVDGCCRRDVQPQGTPSSSSRRAA